MQDKDMKVKELLLELSEVLDRHSHYGAWIDSRTDEIYYVKEMGHPTFITDVIEYGTPEQNYGVKYVKYKNIELRVPSEDEYPYGFTEQDLYSIAFMNGLVRIVFEGNNMGVEGQGEDIKHCARIIAASMAQPDFIMLYIEKFDAHGDKVASDSFEMPRHRRQAIKFINAG
jgi:hypothetical protein